MSLNRVMSKISLHSTKNFPKDFFNNKASATKKNQPAANASWKFNLYKSSSEQSLYIK